MTLNVGIIGLGAMGSDHVKRISERTGGVNLVAVADLNKALVEKYSKKYDAKGYTDGAALIDSPDVDAVMVVTSPDEEHSQFVLKAIEAGKYVFCEKPLMPTVAACQEIIDAETKHGKRLVQVGFMRRYGKGYIEMKKAIDERQFGEPLIIHATHRNYEVPETYDTPMAISNTAVHEADLLHWLLGEDYESGVTFLPKKQTKYTRSNLHDPQIIMLDTKSGVHIDLEVFVNNHMGYDINCEVVCEEGTISLKTPTDVAIKTKFHREDHIPEEFTERFKDAYDNEIQQWVDSVQNDKLTGPSSWDGLIAMATCDALGKSRDEGGIREPIALPEKPALYND
ncbi:Gfo/Idh/MocA family protein [Loigolactobacillus bifermentans]|jgi:myo-inositol 2-dehydrogenase/D-chiro-inositol 1-dehydrogenase|uniref:Inositol 2-dehydrogenase/D-chiro-inositol 3-dehydrogenase n=1 Tax=Loigolactobacillus bifermentans DSM 20003 TaxID=1423726 RepID=A0A0R1GFW6_9LACO|nr:Gfo/Idh/MocA family oxidoreductase [Loigolactobacillus bifermentans]KRK33070.1 iolG protein [Loigolactobacillus bifermentans DSM 20003]QGG59881.1 inositol 2-dehydrogenase [Loigolactobacillus bifermentans]